eukprot:Colp12_sorted_trinity150504_noHs@29462
MSKAPFTPRANGPQEAVALYDFAGTCAEDLPFQKGDRLVILQKPVSSGWFYAQSQSSGKIGSVPANYIQIIAAPVQAPVAVPTKAATPPSDSVDVKLPLEYQPWFHGKRTRQDAEQILTHFGKSDGLFLVRESTTYPGDYTMSLSNAGKFHNYRIVKNENKFSADEEQYFNSIPLLIQHYMLEADGLITKLRTYCPRPDQPQAPPKPETPEAPPVANGPPQVNRMRNAVSEKLVKNNWELDRADLTIAAILGSGHYGDVRDGTYKGKRVAIKTLKEESSKNETIVTNFYKEAEVQAQLSHPNLVKLIGVVTSTLPICIVLEFVDRGSLVDYLRSRGRSVITPPVLQNMVRQIAAAMAFMESLHIIHRDLAARNILVAEGNLVKVGDFGLAVQTENGVYNAPKSQIEFPIKWTSPEALHQNIFSTKSDVWSFGILVWELYSFGRVPYPRMTHKEVVDKIAQGYRMPAPDGCPVEIHNIMLDCWKFKPEDRPSFKVLEQRFA